MHFELLIYIELVVCKRIGQNRSLIKKTSGLIGLRRGLSFAIDFVNQPVFPEQDKHSETNTHDVNILGFNRLGVST